MRAWCADCYFDWSLFMGPGQGRDTIGRREAYERAVEQACDEPLQLEAEPQPHPGQLALPFGPDDEPPADPEEMTAAYRLWVRGARFSLEQLAPSAN